VSTSIPLPVAVFAAAMAGCRPEDSGQPTDDPESAWSGMAKRAVILVHDGVRIEESLGDEATAGAGWSDALGGPTEDLLPLIRARLLPGGAAARPGYVTGYTVTSPAHSYLVTGRREPSDQIPLASEEESYYRPVVPTLFELMRTQLELDASEVVLTGNAKLLEGLEWSLYPGLGVRHGGTFALTAGEDGDAAGTDPPVVEDVLRHLDGGARLVVANMHQVDLTGHQAPEDHAAAVRALDGPTVDLWDRILSASDGLADQTLLVVLADHGRHRLDRYDPPWQHHGCACAGCREVPMLLLGPGIRQGVTFTEPQLPEDVAQTVAWLMGVDLPTGTGMLMEEALVGSVEPSHRTGAVRPSASGDLLAWQQWRGDRSSRSEVVLGDRTFSDPAAIHLEEPRVLRGTRDWACWRRLALDPGQPSWDWQLSCLMDDGSGWTELEPPGIQALYAASPALVETPDGGLLLAMTGLDPAVMEAQVKLARWHAEGGWESPADGVGPLDAAYQARPALAVIDEDIWVAYAGCHTESDCRYSRNVYLQQVHWAEGEDQLWTPRFVLPRTDSAGRAWARLEEPALLARGTTLHLAALAFGADGNTVLTASMDLGSDTWSSTRSLDSTGRVFGHLRPVWGSDDRLYWARLGDDGKVELCRVDAGDTDPACQTTEGTWIDGLAAGQDRAWASLSAGDRQWELVELTW
jgi:hypothetical protein